MKKKVNKKEGMLTPMVNQPQLTQGGHPYVTQESNGSERIQGLERDQGF
jgi:hypothetical protein